MSFNSYQCVSCKDPTKRNAGKYYGKDEKGSYSGPMYDCDNERCNITFERKRTIKAIALNEYGKPSKAK